jgi:uncharacterized protein YggE
LLIERVVQNARMKRLLFSLLILPPSLFAEGGLPDKPYIHVAGYAEVQKPADTLTLKFDLVGTAPNQAKANEEVQSKANNIFGMLKQRKVADSDVIAQNVRTEPQFEEEEKMGTTVISLSATGLFVSSR